jgi:Domain of unknown function (DUF1127)
MRIVDEMRPAKGAAKMVRARVASGTTCDSSLAAQWNASGSRPASEQPASGNRSPQSPSAPDTSRRPIATAMSWLVTCLIESFAAYGEAMSPGFFEAGELIDRQEHSQPRRQPQDEPWSEASWLNATHPSSPKESERSARGRTASAGWRDGITSPVARFWSRMRRERGIRLTIRQLKALDDRTWKDIGTDQGQLESVVQRGRRNE